MKSLFLVIITLLLWILADVSAIAHPDQIHTTHDIYNGLGFLSLSAAILMAVKLKGKIR